MTVHCQKGCGRSWPRHPGLEAPCPDCRAPVGRWCTRPSGHKAQQLHKARYLAAFDAGAFGCCPRSCCRPAERPFASELTPEGEQLLIPGCERTVGRRNPRQLDLF